MTDRAWRFFAIALVAVYVAGFFRFGGWKIGVSFLAFLFTAYVLGWAWPLRVPGWWRRDDAP